MQGRTRVSDGEDIALSVFDELVQATAVGRFPKLDDRDDLLKVLLLLTQRKAANAVRDEARQRRGGGAVRSLDGSEPGAESRWIAGDEPDPAEVAAFADTLGQLLNALGSRELQQVAAWRLEGCTNEEIAKKLGRAVATAERRLNKIRDVWTTMGFGPDSEGN